MKKKPLIIGIGTIVGVCCIVIITRVFLAQRKENYSATEYVYSAEGSFTLTDNGLYYIQDSIAHYYDYESKKDVKLEVNQGDSYYSDGGLGFVYGNKFYCECLGDIDDVENPYVKSTLYRCNLDGSNKSKLFDISGGIGKFYAYQGKIYYITDRYENGIVTEDEYLCNELHEYDLASKKDRILYEIKPKRNEHNGYAEICTTDDRSRIYIYYQYFEGDPLTEEQMRDRNFNIQQFYKGNFRYYDIKTKQVSRCFTQIEEKHFFTNPIVYKHKLYLVESEEESGKTVLQSFTEDGEREVILEVDDKVSWDLRNGMIYMNSLKKPVLYNLYTNECYQADKKVNYRVVTFADSKKYIAVDMGDYSDLKNGDVYTKSRFVPKIIKTTDFLKDFHLCKPGEVEGLQYYKK